MSDRLGGAIGERHVVHAVERDHQVVVGTGLEVLSVGLVEVDVGHAGLFCPGPGQVDRDPRRVDAHTGRVRERFGEGGQHDPAATADVADLGAGLEFVDDTVERGQDRRRQREPRPGSGHAGQARRGIRSLLFVGDAEAGTERVGDAVEHGRVDAPAECTAGKGQRVLLVGEYGGLHVGQFEPAVLVAVDQTGRSLAEEPFADEPLVQFGGVGDFVAGLGTGADHCLVEAETITEVDHERHLFTHLVGPDLEAEHLDGIGVELCRHGSTVDAPSRSGVRRGKPADDQVSR